MSVLFCDVFILCVATGLESGPTPPTWRCTRSKMVHGFRVNIEYKQATRLNQRKLIMKKPEFIKIDPNLYVQILSLTCLPTAANRLIR